MRGADGQKGRWIRPAVRLVFLISALLLLAGGPLPARLVRVVPSLSPLAAVSSALSARGWYMAWFWVLPPLLVLLPAVWKGRVFCRWVCPLGTVYSLPNRFSLKYRFFSWRLNGVIFWFVVGASLAGLPLWLFLDPLSTFTRLGVLAHGAGHAAAWIPGVLVPFFLLMGFVQPLLWCTRLCPLGYFLEQVQFKKRNPVQVSRARRELLAGLLLGVPAALIFRRTGRAVEVNRPVMPPGAQTLDRFAALCERCYACVQVCPTGVLTVRKRGGVAELCLPELDFDRRDGAFCEQYCNACMQVCPTGALKALTQPQKERLNIATASVIRSACLAWTERQYCMACDEFCPYNAIGSRTGGDGIPRPVIDPEKCRGCGACRNICPAEREGNAIRMTPVSVQRSIPPEADARPLLAEIGRRRRGVE